MCLQMHPYRAASTRRAGLRQCCSSCCWKRILVNKGVERRRTGVSQHHPSHEKAAVAPLRLPSAAQTAAFHSKYRLEAAPHPFSTSRFYKFQILFSGSALLLEAETRALGCVALLAGVIPDGRGPSHVGPKWRPHFLFALRTPVTSGV